jgi:hypothetical protein
MVLPMMAAVALGDRRGRTQRNRDRTRQLMPAVLSASDAIPGPARAVFAIDSVRAQERREARIGTQVASALQASGARLQPAAVAANPEVARLVQALPANVQGQILVATAPGGGTTTGGGTGGGGASAVTSPMMTATTPATNGAAAAGTAQGATSATPLTVMTQAATALTQQLATAPRAQLPQLTALTMGVIQAAGQIAGEDNVPPEPAALGEVVDALNGAANALQADNPLLAQAAQALAAAVAAAAPAGAANDGRIEALEQQLGQLQQDGQQRFDAIDRGLQRIQDSLNKQAKEAAKP